MRIHLLKLTITLSLGALFTIYSLNGSTVRANQNGPVASLTGAPGESDCTSCHGGGPTGGTLSINLPANYSPDQEITLTVTLAQQNRLRYGFQLTAIDDSGRRAGDLTPNDGNTQTQLNTVSGNQRQYINHTFAGITPSTPGQGSWTFRWKAPAQSVGRVTFYIAGNAANGNGQSSGDTIYTINQSINPPALAALATVSAASFAAQTNPLAANMIVAGFGTGLAQNVTFATPGQPLPTVLDGTSIVVRDMNGTVRDAGLFFVSTQQVNYLIPPMTVNGPATITLRRNGVDTAQGTVNIETIAPGIFTANAGGSGVPAAVLFRRRGAVDTFETVSQLNPTTNTPEPREIDLGPEGDIVFLIAFGTGIRGLSSLMGASATIGGVNAPIGNVVPAPGFEGLEQINIFIPRTLIGRGLVEVVFTADNKQANPVQILIK
jgi:uncharacterized protein (TIGR03437 family)